MRGEIPIFELDLLKLGLLPKDWDVEIKSIVRAEGFDTQLTGGGVTSRERRQDRQLLVRVTDGVAVKHSLPWLWSLYQGPLREFGSQCFGKSLYSAAREYTAVNINLLEGRAAQYEWHVDSNPVTGVLFVTTNPAPDGGALVFVHPLGQRRIVWPRAGRFVCFDAREVPHRVSPLRSNTERVSVPMNYYDSALDQPRPADLDSQIYTSAVSISGGGGE